MALFKGDAQLLWNQFSELREPQVKSFYPFFQILFLLFLLLVLFSAFSCLFIFICSCFHFRLLYSTTYCFSCFPSHLFPFIFPLSIVAFCPKILVWKYVAARQSFQYPVWSESGSIKNWIKLYCRKIWQKYHTGNRRWKRPLPSLLHLPCRLQQVKREVSMNFHDSDNVFIGCNQWSCNMKIDIKIN